MGCFVIYTDVSHVIENPPAHKVSFGILRSTKCIENKWQRYVRIAYSGERMVYQSFGSHGTRKSTCNGQSTGQAFTEPHHVFHCGIEHYEHYGLGAMNKFLREKLPVDICVWERGKAARYIDGFVLDHIHKLSLFTSSVYSVAVHWDNPIEIELS